MMRETTYSRPLTPKGPLLSSFKKIDLTFCSIVPNAEVPQKCISRDF